MVELENLRTASLYINNQLLSRGLLRDGRNIDFADPANSDGGLQTTMGKAMSVINDLILRRDRDAEHRESVSTTLRTLRTESQRQTTELARQAEKLDDAQRRLDGAEATERALRAQLRAAEQGAHKLREEAARAKALAAQARAACATEIRKRDRQIDGLKKAVADASRVRGGTRNSNMVYINVTGDVGGDGGGPPAGATEVEGYSLRLETNAFLTELARGLSEENESLLAILQRTIDGLRDMSGLDKSGPDKNGSSSQHHSRRQDVDNMEVVFVPPQRSGEELATELEAIMEHLRTILTNPSFVPIEEVEVREEAINRLRMGLETMESRWKDAVHMIDGWRKRMVSSGRSVDMEDLRMGLRLSPVRVRDVEETADVIPISTRLSCVHEEDEDEQFKVEEEDREYEEEEDLAAEAEAEARLRLQVPKESPRLRSPVSAESLHLVPAPGYGGENGENSDSDSSSIFEDDEEIDMEELDAEEPNVQVLQESTMTSVDSPPLPVPPQLSPLKDSYSSGNRGSSGNDQTYQKRPGDFSTITEENTRHLAAARAEEQERQAPTPPPHVIKPQLSPRQQPKKSATSAAATGPKRSPTWQEPRPSSNTSYDSPLFGKSGERPSQSTQKLFSKPTTSLGRQAQGKAETPEPENTGTQTAATRTPTARTPTSRPRGMTTSSSKASPDPASVEIKRTNSDPVNTPTRPQRSSTSRCQAPAASQSQPAPSVSSSSRQLINVVTTTNTAHPQQPAQSRPRSAKRPAQTSSTTTTTAAAAAPATTAPATATAAVNGSNAGNGNAATTTSASSANPTSTSSRLPRPNTISGTSNTNNTTNNGASNGSALPQPQQSPLTMATIAAKLAASEREADAARVRAKLRALRSGRRLAPAPIITSTTATTAPAASPTTASSKMPSLPSSPAIFSTIGGSIRPLEEEHQLPPQEDRRRKSTTDPVKRDRDPPQQQIQQSPPIRRTRCGRRRKTGEEVPRRRDTGGSVHSTGPAAEADGSPDELLAGSVSEKDPPPRRLRRERREEAQGETLRAHNGDLGSREGDEGNDGVGEIKVPKRKRDRTSKVASRRRSTLSPWELETLIQGNTPGG
ncbi:Afadin and alpha-actinin-binding-domain-containing protein [Durotheca rogersii]|uniref:Afadin and alpha-actinin-binding-domain-containing protein n=1 Tax=Durotheca rogersii TaxID=419775 RepID=UPI002220AF68|nr:Afadin and alpha-actinin-binding-domain-containing protein [Durotheca rogersii]KAI5860768.1 Afadin and alpha-actinin-binding-domain-containing protein [Durotheca rogersii]